MARSVTLKGNPINLAGNEVAVGDTAPDFAGTGTDLGQVKLSDYAGKVVILSTVPSIDTGICDLQTKRLNQEAAENDFTVLTVSCDLPFAFKRWCGASNAEAVVCVSDYKSRSVGKAYGLEMADGPLAALIARSVSVIGKDGKIAYQELVPEITQEPDYDKAIAAAKAAG